MITFSSDAPFEKRDYFVVHLGNGDHPRKLSVNSLFQEGLGGYWHNPGGESSSEVCVANSQMNRFDLLITQYKDELIFRYTSPIGFLVQQTFLVPKIRFHKHRILQFLFNKQRLAREDRFVVLRHIFERSVVDRDYKVGPISLISELFQHNHWLHHPDSKALESYYSLVLDSLHKTGDLEGDRNFYALAPAGLATLESYEESDRRHKDQVRQQQMIAALTLVLVIVGLLQVLATVLAGS